MALLLSMSTKNYVHSMGYEYPIPEVPFIEGATVSTASYDDYDPNDIPEDQAAPSDSGYQYPVPENPLLLPTKKSTTIQPCIPSYQNTDLSNPLSNNCHEYDDYDPSDIPVDQAKPVDDIPSYSSSPKTLIISTTSSYYDDYDPNDVPEDQAEIKGYEYPVPEIPFTLPTKSPSVPTTTKPSNGYLYPVPSNPLQLPSKSRKAKVAKLVQENNDHLLLIGLAHHKDDSYDPEYYDHNSPDYIDNMDDVFYDDVTRSSKFITESGISLKGKGNVISFHVPAASESLKETVKNSNNLNVIIDGIQKMAKIEDTSKGPRRSFVRQPKQLEESPNREKEENRRPSNQKQIKDSVKAWLRRG